MTGPTLLILEDDLDVAQELCRRLMALGYSLLPVVEREAEVPLAIRTGKPDLIVLDLHFGGPHLGPKLAARLYELHDLPVVLMIPRPGIPGPDLADLSFVDGLIAFSFDDFSLRATLELAGHHRQSERRLRENQNQLAAILKSIGDGVMIVDGQGLIQFVNPVAAKFIGISETHALGASLDSVVTITDPSTQQQINAADFLRNRRDTGPLFGFEVVLFDSNRTRIPVEGSFAPLRDHLGLLHGAVIAFRSLSEIQRSLEQINAQAARSEALLRIITHINSKLKIDEMLASFLQESTQVLDADAAAVLLADGDGEPFRVVSAHTLTEGLSSYDGEGFEFSPEVVRTLFAQGQPVSYFPNLQELTWVPYQGFYRQQDIRSLVVARLQHEDYLQGVLIFVTIRRDRSYSREELQFIKGSADYVSVALATGRLFETMHASRSRLQMVTRRLVEVQEAERRSVARELHDQVGQVLTGLQFSLETGKRLAEGSLRVVFEESQQLVTNLMKQIRELSLKLSPSMLDDLGLLRTLLWHFEHYKTQTGIQVHFSQTGLEKRFPAEIEITAYRIVQEALTNVARYAKVDQVEVTLNVEGEVLRLQVRDLGLGFDPQKTIKLRTTFGLTSMKERAFLVGGQLTVKTAPGAGTEILAVIPLSRPLERRRYDR